MAGFVTFFDVGGVVIKDFSQTHKWEELKKSLGVSLEKDAQFNEIWNQYKDSICLDFNINDLVPILNQKLQLNLSPDFSLLAEFIQRFEPNSEIIEALIRAKNIGRVGLLTNMYVGMLKEIRVENLLPSFSYDFVIDSSQVLLQKPDRKIFDYAEKISGAKGENILFIDNSPEHVIAAQKLGWQTQWFDSTNYPGSNLKILDWLKQK